MPVLTTQSFAVLTNQISVFAVVFLIMMFGFIGFVAVITAIGSCGRSAPADS